MEPGNPPDDGAACVDRKPAADRQRRRRGPDRDGSAAHGRVRPCGHLAGATHSVPRAQRHMSIVIPESFSTGVTGRAPEPHISGDAWLLQLPGLVEASLAEWDLTLDGDPMHGVCALVLPVQLRDDSTGVLKVTWPHADAEHEPPAWGNWEKKDALRHMLYTTGR